MEIKIVRTESSILGTIGSLSINGIKLCATWELSEVNQIDSPDVPHAIPKGRYQVGVVVNPMQGTPVIKVQNPNIAHNVSIRCLRPMSIKNSSITLCNLVGREARPATEPMIKEWSMLLVGVMTALSKDEEVSLLIV